MKLSNSEKSTLLLAFVEAIPQVKVLPVGIFIQQGGAAWARKTLDSLEGDSAARLNKHFDDGGIQGFIVQELQREFHRQGLDLPETGFEPKPLNTFPPFEDALSAARKLIERIKDLPAQFRIMTRASQPLTRILGDENVEIAVSKQLKLVSGARLPKNFRLTNDNEAINKRIIGSKLSDGERLATVPNALYFEYRTSGYISERLSSPVRDFSDELRAFYGACVASNILLNDAWFDDLEPIILVNELNGEESEMVHMEGMDTDLLKATNIETSEVTDQLAKDGKSLSEVLSPVIDMFAAEESAKLTTAAIWMLRAHLSARGMDKILEATIAIEVLLGDREASDRVGLGKLMGNRCAYSLGRTASARKEMTEFFTHFYKVRSDIVHSGRFKLSREERSVVSKGLALADRILAHEIRMSKH